MSKYRMEDGTVVDTEKAQRCWEETTDWNGHNNISRVTGGQFEHQTLYKSRKGRYYVQNWSQYEGRKGSVEWVSPEEATRWLVLNDYELPDDLKHLEAEVTE